MQIRIYPSEPTTEIFLTSKNLSATGAINLGFQTAENQGWGV